MDLKLPKLDAPGVILITGNKPDGKCQTAKGSKIKLAGLCWVPPSWDGPPNYFFSLSTLARLDLVTTGFCDATVLALFSKGVSISKEAAGLFLLPIKGVLGVPEGGAVAEEALVLRSRGRSDDRRK